MHPKSCQHAGKRPKVKGGSCPRHPIHGLQNGAPGSRLDLPSLLPPANQLSHAVAGTARHPLPGFLTLPIMLLAFPRQQRSEPFCTVRLCIMPTELSHTANLEEAQATGHRFSGTGQQQSIANNRQPSATSSWELAMSPQFRKGLSQTTSAIALILTEQPLGPGAPISSPELGCRYLLWTCQPRLPQREAFLASVLCVAASERNRTR